MIADDVRAPAFARNVRHQTSSSRRARNHAQAIVAIDLFVVPTLTFERLFPFLVLGHGRRQLLWFEVTRHPTTAEWLARQITEAFPRKADATDSFRGAHNRGQWLWIPALAAIAAQPENKRCYSAAMRTSGAAERMSGSTCCSYLTKFLRTSLRAVSSNAALSFRCITRRWAKRQAPRQMTSFNHISARFVRSQQNSLSCFLWICNVVGRGLFKSRSQYHGRS
jgi:hypothetical protein